MDIQKLKRYPVGRQSISAKNKPHRLKCNTGNFQCGARCVPIAYSSKRTGKKEYTNCSKNATGMAKNGLEYLTNQAERIDAVNQHRTTKGKASLFIDQDAKYKITKAQASKFVPPAIAIPPKEKPSPGIPKLGKAKYQRITTVEQAIESGEAIAGEWLKQIQAFDTGSLQFDIDKAKIKLRDEIENIALLMTEEKSPIKVRQRIKEENADLLKKTRLETGNDNDVFYDLYKEAMRKFAPLVIEGREKELQEAERKMELPLALAKQLIRHLEKTSEISLTSAKNMVEDSIALPGSMPTGIKKQLVEAIRLSNGRGLHYLRGLITTTPDVRAFASVETGKIVIPEENDTKRVLFHEYGHFIEHTTASLDNNPAIDFLKKRATGDIKPLGSKYKGEQELYYPDHFLSNYTGKTYLETSNATEIISMGFQEFASPERLLNFAKQDPEHFLFTLGYVRQTAQGIYSVVAEKTRIKHPRANLFKTSAKAEKDTRGKKQVLKIKVNSSDPLTPENPGAIVNMINFSSPSANDKADSVEWMFFSGEGDGFLKNNPSYQVAQAIFRQYPEILNPATRKEHYDNYQTKHTVQQILSMTRELETGRSTGGNLLEDMYNGDVGAMLKELGKPTKANWEALESRYHETTKYKLFLSGRNPT